MLRLDSPKMAAQASETHEKESDQNPTLHRLRNRCSVVIRVENLDFTLVGSRYGNIGSTHLDDVGGGIHRQVYRPGAGKERQVRGRSEIAVNGNSIRCGWECSARTPSKIEDTVKPRRRVRQGHDRCSSRDDRAVRAPEDIVPGRDDIDGRG